VRPFIDGAGKAAMLAAIREVESRSAAELVIAVQPAAGDYVHADLIAAAIAAFAALTFLLFAHQEFGLVWLLLDPLVVGALVALLSARSPRLRRLFTPASRRRAFIELAAHAAFFERGVHMTSGRTGVLVYIGLTERMAAVVADRGVEAIVPADRWRAARRRVEDAMAHGAPARALALAAAISGLADALEPYLPRADDDINELPDEVLE
jgi:putative membrane protein